MLKENYHDGFVVGTVFKGFGFRGIFSRSIFTKTTGMTNDRHRDWSTINHIQVFYHVYDNWISWVQGRWILFETKLSTSPILKLPTFCDLERNTQLGTTSFKRTGRSFVLSLLTVMDFFPDKELFLLDDWGLLLEGPWVSTTHLHKKGRLLQTTH